MSLTDVFVYCLMLAVLPLFLVVVGLTLLITAPVWVPIELHKWWVRRHG